MRFADSIENRKQKGDNNSCQYRVLCPSQRNMEFSESQYFTIAILPMVSGSLSVLGSTAIAVIILRSNKRLSTTYNRLVFGMSLMDVIYSIAFIGSTLPSPRGIEPLWKAIGNVHTCTLQGLMFYVGSTGATMYNCMLAIFYLLTITKNVHVDTMTKKIEPYFHAIPGVYLLLSSIVLLATQSFNTAGSICMIAPYPKNCNKDPDLECERGSYSAKFLWYFNLYPVMISFFTVIYCMVRVYWCVREQEKRMQQYDTVYQIRRRNSSSGGGGGGNSPASAGAPTPRISVRPESRNKRAAMTQCFFYVMAFFLAWVFGGVYRIVLTLDKLYFPLWVLSQFMCPLQGVFNFLVFMRPKVQSIRRSDQNLSWSRACIAAVLAREWDVASRRRRSSLNVREGGTRRYTAREWHLRNSCNQVQLELGDESQEEKNNE